MIDIDVVIDWILYTATKTLMIKRENWHDFIGIKIRSPTTETRLIIHARHIESNDTSTYVQADNAERERQDRGPTRGQPAMIASTEGKSGEKNPRFIIFSPFPSRFF
jgi:hypothetical protein